MPAGPGAFLQHEYFCSLQLVSVKIDTRNVISHDLLVDMSATALQPPADCDSIRKELPLPGYDVMTANIALTYIFKGFIAIHVVAGAIGLASFWVPVIGRKGGAAHRWWGRVFAFALIIAGALAVAMSLITLIIPLETHSKLSDIAMIRGLFGWLMFYLGFLTVALAWFGLNCIWNKRDHHHANRHWLNVGLLCMSAGAALNCAWQGWQIGQMIMIGVAPVGVVAAVVFLRFIFRRNPKPKDYVLAHFRALIGAGISVYTAFLAFGAVQLMPSQAFNPTLWCVPSVVGLSIVAYHEVMASAGRRSRVGEEAAHASGTPQSS
jgi:hypothetical protein